MRRLAIVLLVFAAALSAHDGYAWSEFGHLSIGEHAMARLGRTREDAHTARVLRAMWATIRAHDGALHEALCPGIDGAAGSCVRLADLPLLAGDHACTPSRLGASLGEPWVREVLRLTRAAQQRIEVIANRQMSPAAERSARTDVRRQLDLELHGVDIGYLDRASQNLGHFVRPRRLFDSLSSWLARSLSSGEPQNATAQLAAHHTTALVLAWRAAREHDRREQGRWLWRSLLEEAFALHYLQDAFSAGHIVGTPDEDAERFGTHDFYSAHGVALRTWSGERYVAHGDAFQREEDRRRAATAMGLALAQLAWAFRPDAAFLGEPPLSLVDIADLASLSMSPEDRVDLDGCERAGLVPPAVAALGPRPWLARVLALTPQPAVEPPGLATFRNEYGLFTPVALTLEGAAHLYAAGGEVTAVSQARLASGIGYGSDGVVGDYRDGLTYLQVAAAVQNEQLSVSSVGLGFQFRLPFAAVPGDFVVWGPLVPFGVRWAVEAFHSALRGQTVFGGSVLYQSASLRLEAVVGRQATFMWYFDTASFCTAGAFDEPGAVCRRGGRLRYARWDATVPLVTLRVLHLFGDRFADDVGLGLAARAGSSLDTFRIPAGDDQVLRAGAYFGAVLSLENSTRFYW